MSTNYVEDFSDVSEEDLKPSRPYPEEGQYFLMIDNVDDSRTKVDGMQVSFLVCSGTVEGQYGKKFTETFFDPKPENKDGGKFLRSRRIKLLLATGIASSLEELKAKGFQWSPESLMYRCLKAVVVHSKSVSKKNNKEYTNAQIDGLDIYAPNEKGLGHIPIHQETLAMCFEHGQANAVMPDDGKAAEPASARKPEPVATKQGALPGTATPSKSADPYAAL